jgi:hypothetical protein
MSGSGARLGPSVLAALDDPDVIEIILNPDGTPPGLNLTAEECDPPEQK